MNDEILTSEKILEAAEEVLRRFGPGKATVVDVAKVLGVSHGSVYRHFPSKAALRDAVAARWLERVAKPLDSFAEESGSATDRLLRWIHSLAATKRQRALDDPELFANYMELAHETREVTLAHVEHLLAQLVKIISDGIAQGEFKAGDPALIARAVFDATHRFHNPINVAAWREPDIVQKLENVCSLLLNGLRSA